MTDGKSIRVGLIGSGFMGRSHAIAIRTASAVFGLDRPLVLELLADVDAPTASRAGLALGISRTTGDWHALIVPTQGSNLRLQTNRFSVKARCP